MSDDDVKVVHASPTKEFFISILIRDINLIDAICDLVDNAVDGATRLRNEGSFEGLHISIEAKPESFVIADNCGGIEVAVARDYAFRFGRPKDSPNLSHSIGKFGVGMKRAFFKMGSVIDIASTAATSNFSMKINVANWVSPENVDSEGREVWDFNFDQVEEGKTNPLDKTQSLISITSLHASISDEFKSPSFHSRLVRAVESAHLKAIEKGLAIRIGETELSLRQLSLLQSPLIKPHSSELTIGDGPKAVRVRIYAGIGEQKLSESGWYVFCNDRLIVQADKTPLTGWGTEEENGVDIPRAHYQFARFRGYVFFDAVDAEALPWNTTKNGVDPESPIYQAVRLRMINSMRPIIDFLNAVDKELGTDEARLQTIVNSASSVPLRAVTFNATFVSPTPEQIQQTTPKEGRVTYSAAQEKLDIAKKLLGVTSNKAVGEATFNYFLRANGDE